jgi:hypothetical protein
MYFTISNTGLTERNGAKLVSEQHGSLKQAVEILQATLGWETIHLSEWYAVDSHDDAVSAYATQRERDADETGAYAPRITRREGSA